MLNQKESSSAAIHASDGVAAAIPVSRVARVTTGPPIVAAPIAVAAAPRGGFSALFPALCCLGLILFLIAATIILSLIPVYTRNRGISPIPPETTQINNMIANGTIIRAGVLNAQQRAALQQRLQQVLNSNPDTADATVRVVSATGVANTRRKRQSTSTASFVRSVVVIIFRRTGRFRRLVLLALNSYIIDDNLAKILQSLANPITTTTTAATTTNGSRVLVRRSLEEGGAPAGVVYVDAHKIAAVQGIVKSVSFYVDQTCGSAKIQFGAFEMISRDIGTNTAELQLKQSSGELTLDDSQYMTSFMTLITIRLCTGNKDEDANGDSCQGHAFPVLPHQYLGIRSDKCRFGFAEAPNNLAAITTWMASDNANAFEVPDQTLNYVPASYIILQSVDITPDDSFGKEKTTTHKTIASSSPHVLFVGTYPPRRCGLATFLEDLTDNYPGPYRVVAVDEKSADAAEREYPEKVIYRLNTDDRDGYFKVADIANSVEFDVVNIQHEYGVYGGMVGEYAVAMLAAIRKPVIITLHTVIPEPDNMYISVTRALCALSSRVVVMTELGRQLLVDLYGVDPSKIVIVPHGVPDVKYSHSLAAAKSKIGYDPNVPIIATFGLIHRNKNIQLGLNALATVVRTVPDVIYLVIGGTHPAVRLAEGEKYREELQKNVTALGLTKNVKFIDKFISDNDLISYLDAVDIYLTPYAREDQYVSGTLSWAVGLGKAVVSTPYMYAKELLANGRGFLVPFEDHEFLGSILTRLIQDHDLRNNVRREAYKFGRQMAWPTVGRKLEGIFRELVLFQ